MKIRTTRHGILALLAGACVAQASAQDGLSHLKGPQGGEIVYGPVSGPGNVAGAMGAVLRQLHGRFGARPEVGRVVELRGSGTSTLRFSIKPPQGPAVAGMIVVAPGVGDGLEAGVVFDEASRLATSFNPLVQALTAAWHPGAPPAGGADAGGAAAALHNVVLGDQSARVGLPQGWRIDPQSSGGTILAHGPNGEFAALAAPYFVIDTRSPQGRQMQSMSGRPGTIYASALYYPFGAPLGRTFMDLTRMMTERSHAPAMPIRVDSEEPLSGSQGGTRCARLRGQGGIEAGRGPGTFDTVFCVSPPQQGSWIALAYHVAAPTAVAGPERATLLAVRASFAQNKAVVDHQANAIAAPVIAQIHEIGRQSAIAAAQADATRIDTRNRFEAYNTTRDRLAQGFTNYQRDQTVVLDANTNTHTTEWNAVAEGMVKNEPQRYSYVDTPGYWKGVDY